MSDFSSRLEVVLKVLSCSRGRLASELGIDKSVISRWAAGKVDPSSHNLERLTQFVALYKPGFSMMDWERDPSDLAVFLGADPALIRSGPAPLPSPVSPALLAAGRAALAARGGAYRGFWRLTRPAVVAPGRFCQDHGILFIGETGLLEFRLGNPDFQFSGWALPIEGQIFCTASDTTGGIPSFLIVNTVPMPRTMLLDGIILTALNALRKPAAYPIILERIGDLSGDEDRDFAQADAMMMANPQFVDPEAVPEPVRAHLLRDVGPRAQAEGGDLLLSASMRPTLDRLIEYLTPV